MDIEIIGRERELEAAEAFLDAGYGGARAIVITGPPGIGKTTIWQGVLSLAEARGHRILSSRSVESEAKLSYAGLGDLIGPVLDEVADALPQPQRRALEIALLRTDGGSRGADRRAVSLAVQGLLIEVAAQGYVVLAIDDVQWVDRPSASALSFALHRISSEPVLA